MREILFRGKREDTGEWVCGFYVVLNNIEHRIYDGYAETDCGDYYPDAYSVDPVTVGQYTGLTDKNGKRIFEGDIVQYPIEQGNHRGTNLHKVIFEHRGGSAYFGIVMNAIETWQFCLSVPSKLMEVIGNIHDNPELMKGAEQ